MDDVRGWRCFLTALDKLEQEKYPYRPSIAACFFFSELLGLTYDKQGLIKNNSPYGSTPTDQSISEYWASLKNKLNFSMDRLYRDFQYSGDRRGLKRFRSDGRLSFNIFRDHFDLSLLGKKNIRTLLYHGYAQFDDSMIVVRKKDRIFWPVFDVLSVDDMNLLHHLPSGTYRFYG